MYAMRPRDLNALSALVTYEMQRNARGNYVADMLWLIAGGKQYKDGSVLPFSEMIKDKGPDEEETADDIIERIKNRMKRGEQK